ncbi:putative lipid-binding transport protein (Tim44 family) [Actimicrobium sp. GrIS 1.19]|uniref:Tim44 domain-containing protein n=1 Tax=Actimicrobium sp. GrIS 1.19 TaxID=3071708 RepID=UPI002E08B102|nr:putative lipid-binding transport protein (Tim44 family) [Actimicrobium sp. GrIS 1.19]
MKKYLFVLMMAISAMALVATDADARRLGGGGSFGKQSQNLSRPAPSQPAQSGSQARPAAPAAAPQGVPPKPASPWRGMLGGALLGLGAGALLSHFGMGGAMGGMFGSLLMFGLLAAAVFFIVRMFRRKSPDNGNKPSFAGAYESNNASYTPEIGSRIEPAALQSAAPVGGAQALPWGVPADFDVPGFLRNAKTYFIRLQAAWDKADINDIREFTSSEMFGELRLQIQERGASANNTDVVTLDAELVGVESVGNDYLASVKFSGMIKESDAEPAAPFKEVWNLSKPISGSGGWILAGIQQLP